ncbi:hypothetical protein NBC122_01594 [Chryseobacterium salivictor]|uniref:Uncharacterized protein n=1 Tax=Chryseobacterium salivictor TaxID=2547600 RepID=A0A4P6ZFV6_9FLAO|nr:hypothetical protein NBC122_01594 [Chryseobacterium salivictor]
MVEKWKYFFSLTKFEIIGLPNIAHNVPRLAAVAAILMLSCKYIKFSV